MHVDLHNGNSNGTGEPVLCSDACGSMNDVWFYERRVVLEMACGSRNGVWFHEPTACGSMNGVRFDERRVVL